MLISVSGNAADRAGPRFAYPMRDTNDAADRVVSKVPMSPALMLRSVPMSGR